MVPVMRQTLTFAFSAMTLCVFATSPAKAAVQAAPQTPPPSGQPRTAEDLTRDLNSGPPYPAARPAATAVPAPMAAPAAASPAADALTRSLNSGPPAAALPARAAAPEVRAAPPATPSLSPPAASPRPTPPPAPAAQPAAAPHPPAAAGPAPLDAAARARLPFTLTLPGGTEIVETPSGETFDTWAVRHGDTTLVRLYAGPASQFPVYDGEIRTLNGRSTVVVADGTARRALEHLFERDGATPREIHVLVATLDGADLALAEAIGQSIDPR